MQPVNCATKLIKTARNARASSRCKPPACWSARFDATLLLSFRLAAPPEVHSLTKPTPFR